MSHQTLGSGKKPPSKVVFIGNIPYDFTEPQLLEIFREAGPVINLRLIFDKDTNKPRGYGFCTYQDIETASSAVRNLNNYAVSGGRELRVDFAESDKEVKLPNTDLIQQQIQQQQGNLTQQSLPPPQVTYNNSNTVEQVIKNSSSGQLLEVFSQIKLLLVKNPVETKLVLTQNPQLTYGIFQAMLQTNIVEPSILQNLLVGSQQQLQQPLQQYLPQQQQYQSQIPVQYPSQSQQFQSQQGYAGISQQHQQQPSQGFPAQSYHQQPAQQQYQQQPPAIAGVDALADQQRQFLMQVLALTPQEIALLPLDQQENIRRLKEKVQGGI
ncbi:Cleavage stimulation factor subunit 2 [Lobulomyces angularis]|nr:Cleavage stimulation factor subunit 2 [Lobulomyces angularis]